MAITESDFLRICKGKASYLLLRSSTHFHLIKEDAALSESKYKKLLKLYPCDLQQLQNLKLHVSTFRAENLRHIIVKGFRAGDELELWLGSDIQRYQLAEKYTDAILTAFFSGYSITRRLPPPWTGLDPKLIRSIILAINCIAVVSSLAFLLFKNPYWLWSTLCLLCQFASIFLVYLFPASFVLDDRKDAHVRKGNKQGNLLVALLAPSFALALRTFTDFTFVGNTFWLLLLISSFVFSAALLPMVFISRNTRNRLVTTAAIVPLMIFLGMGTIQQFNYLLDFTSAKSHVVVVTDKETDYGGKATSYYCTVQFQDGESRKLSVSVSDYKRIDIYEEISVAYYDGFFHIPFYKISDI